MAEEKYVDPNSGAAPQPGGYAGAHAVEAGHGTPGAAALITDGESSNYDDEQQASADKALETEGVNLPASSADGSDAESEQSDGEEEPGQYDELLSGTVADVQDYLSSHPDEKDAVVEAENKRENPRKGITEA